MKILEDITIFLSDVINFFKSQVAFWGGDGVEEFEISIKEFSD